MPRSGASLRRFITGVVVMSPAPGSMGTVSQESLARLLPSSFGSGLEESHGLACFPWAEAWWLLVVTHMVVVGLLSCKAESLFLSEEARSSECGGRRGGGGRGNFPAKSRYATAISYLPLPRPGFDALLSLPSQRLERRHHPCFQGGANEGRAEYSFDVDRLPLGMIAGWYTHIEARKRWAR